jgi:hypothetical protein
VFLMEIKIFRRYMSILSVHVYKPSINSTVNELFVMYDVKFCFERRIKNVNFKATCSMLQKITLNMSLFVSSR